jgi:hypothetical protein
MRHPLTAAARAITRSTTRNEAGSLKKVSLLESICCHALVYVRIFRHVSPSSRRAVGVATVRAGNRGRTHKHEGQQ